MNEHVPTKPLLSPTALVHKLRAEDRAFTGAIDFDDPPARPA